MEHPLNDKGSWSAKQEPINDFSKQVWVESDDFKHDVRLYIDGDFEDIKQRFSYAENIAKYLNDYDSVANQMREHVHRKTQLEAQDAEVKRLREALERIADPIKFLADEAKKSGNQLNGQMAIQIANDPAWLQQQAHEALKGGE